MNTVGISSNALFWKFR